MNWISKIVGALSNEAPVPIPDNAVLIDVRSPGEFAGGHLPGAINLPLELVASQIDRLVSDKSQPIVVYCASGMRSGNARSALAQLGYRQVINGGGAGSLSLRLGKPLQRA